MQRLIQIQLNRAEGIMTDVKLESLMSLSLCGNVLQRQRLPQKKKARPMLSLNIHIYKIFFSRKTNQSAKLTRECG